MTETVVVLGTCNLTRTESVAVLSSLHVPPLIYLLSVLVSEDHSREHDQHR